MSADSVATTDAIDIDTLRRLYTAPPAEFVATRTSLVAERRQAKDRAGATAIAGLRKASGVDVALNRVAEDEPAVVEDFLTAAGAVREAQTAAAEGRSSASTRDALRELRAQTATVVARATQAAGAAGITGVTTAAATARLGELVANEAAGEQLRAGHLGSDVVEAADPFGAGDDGGSPPAPPARRSGKTAATRSAGRTSGRSAPEPTAAGRVSGRAAAPPAVADESPAPPRPDPKAAARRQRREAALAKAIDQRDRAQAELDGADEEVAAARAGVAELEAQLAARRADLERAEQGRAKRAAAVERADAAVADAEAALDDG